MLEEILREIEEIEYPSQEIGCGLEGEGITDRYEAAAYGYGEAQERIEAIIRSHMDDDGWIYCGDGKNLPKEEGWYMCTLHGGDHSYLCISNYETGCLGGWQYENVIAYYPKPFAPYHTKQKAVGEDYKQRVMERFMKTE